MFRRRSVSASRGLFEAALGGARTAYRQRQVVVHEACASKARRSDVLAPPCHGFTPTFSRQPPEEPEMLTSE
eukprot:4319978-Alexandrium_andersonii.AAC.1